MKVDDFKKLLAVKRDSVKSLKPLFSYKTGRVMSSYLDQYITMDITNGICLREGVRGRYIIKDKNTLVAYFLLYSLNDGQITIISVDDKEIKPVVPADLPQFVFDNIDLKGLLGPGKKATH